MSVIRKKPYVEKVVESLSSDSLELLRETLNTNKDNVNVSLVGGSNLLKRFEKEYVGVKYPTHKDLQVTKIYFNPNAYKTFDEIYEATKGFFWYPETGVQGSFITGDISSETSEPLETINIVRHIETKSFAVIYTNSSNANNNFGYALAHDKESFDDIKSIFQSRFPNVTITGEYQGTGWYSTANATLTRIDEIDEIDNISITLNLEDDTINLVLNLFSFNAPFVSSNTQLIGHIPQVGDVVEKVYFNPNTYSTDEEWELWYESMKDNVLGGGGIDTGSKVLGSLGADTLADLINAYEFGGYILTDILVMFVCEIYGYGYITNKALTGTYAQIYQQLGITETGWYKIGGTAQAPTFTKVTTIQETDAGNNTGSSVVSINETNAKHFAKALSFNETFTETPVQNLLKPNPIQVGQEVSKIYINLGYFDNDLNKMVAFGDKTLFKWQNGEDTYELKTAFNYEEGDQVWTTQFELYKNGEDSQPCIYLNQAVATMIGGLAGKDFQEYVNKWVKVKNNATEVEELENQKVFELEIQGTITELGDTSLISFNKPFTEIGGYIYDEITPVNLQLESNNLKTGILVWNNEYCTLLAYHRFEDMREYEIDYTKYSFKAINESLTINELRRVVFTPTQESTTLDLNSLDLEEDKVIFEKTFGASDITNGLLRITKEDNELFDINCVYKLEVPYLNMNLKLFIKPSINVQLPFICSMIETNGGLADFHLTLSISNNNENYLMIPLVKVDTPNNNFSTYTETIMNYFAIAFDGQSEDYTITIKLAKMKYVSK